MEAENTKAEMGDAIETVVFAVFAFMAGYWGQPMWLVVVLLLLLGIVTWLKAGKEKAGDV